MTEAPPTPETIGKVFDLILGQLSGAALQALRVVAAPHWLPPGAAFLQLRDILPELPGLIDSDLVRVSTAGRLFVSDSLRAALRARSSPDEIDSAAARMAAIFRSGGDVESEIEAYFHQLFLEPLDASSRIFRSILEWQSEPFFAYHLVQRLTAVWIEAHEQRPLPPAAEAYLRFVQLSGGSASAKRNLAELESLDAGEDRLFEAHLLLRRGTMLTMLNRLSDAQICLSRAFVLFETLDDPVGMSHAHRLLGRVAAKRDAYATATRLFLHALELARKTGRKMLIAQALQGIADVAAFKGDFPEAAARYEEAIASLVGIGGRTAEANVRNSFSQVLTATGEFELAREHIRLAAKTFETLEQPIGRANSLRAAAQVEIETGELDQAAAHLEEARSLYRELGTKTGLAAATEFVGQVAQLQGDLDRAEKEFSEAQAMFEAIGDRLGAASCLRDRGALALERNDKVRAAELLSRAAGEFGEIGAKAEGAAATLLLWLARDNVDPEPAERILTEAGAHIPRTYRRAWSASPKPARQAVGWKMPRAATAGG